MATSDTLLDVFSIVNAERAACGQATITTTADVADALFVEALERRQAEVIATDIKAIAEAYCAADQATRACIRRSVLDV